MRYCTRFLFSSLLTVFFTAAEPASISSVPPGWTATAHRQEIRPEFSYLPSDGRAGSGAFVIATDARDGLDGAWEKTFPVEGGKWYRFTVFRRTKGTEYPQQCGAI